MKDRINNYEINENGKIFKVFYHNWLYCFVKELSMLNLTKT